MEKVCFGCPPDNQSIILSCSAQALIVLDGQATKILNTVIYRLNFNLLIANFGIGNSS